MRIQNKHGISFLAFLLIFLSPYLWLIPKITFQSVNWAFLAHNYYFSFSQALFSTLLTVAGAFIGALGLLWLEGRAKPRYYALFEFTILIPSLLPALFLVVPLLNLVPGFPFGFYGIVLFHAISEVGLVALVLKKILSHRLSAYGDFAWLAGSSSLRFLVRMWPLLRMDVLHLSMVLLIYFLTSFSIPLLIGGNSFASLEVTLYEQIVVHHNWTAAMNIFVFQFVCIMALLFILSFFKTPKVDVVENQRIRILEKPLGILFLALPPLLIFFGLFSKLNKGLEMIFVQPYVLENWDRYFVGSLIVGFLTSGAVFVGLTLVTYFLQFQKFRPFFSSFFTPSFVIVAFSFALLPGYDPSLILVKISWALTVALLPTLLRFGLLQKISTLDEQLDMASFMGAPSLYVFRKITWPQCLPLISMMSGLGGVWAVGDFSLARVIAGRDANLAMWVQSLVDQYRWDMALVLSWSILLCALIIFGFFWGLAYVARQKLT